MQNIRPIAAMALSLLLGPLAWGQSEPNPQDSTPSKINLTLEQRHVIKETVKDLKIDSAAANVQVTIGEAVPTTIQLHPLPTQIAEKMSHIKNHLFFIKGGQTVIVDPKDNKVVDIIE